MPLISGDFYRGFTYVSVTDGENARLRVGECSKILSGLELWKAAPCDRTDSENTQEIFLSYRVSYVRSLRGINTTKIAKFLSGRNETYL